MTRARTAVLASALILASGLVPAAAARQAPCTSHGLPGGDWPAYGGPVLGQNSQVSERRITPATASQLALAWTSPATSFQSVPVVAGRCVYLTDVGHVEALDVVTGRRVWRTPAALPFTEYAPFAVAVSAGRVHVNYDNRRAPRGVAFDANTGRLLWTSKPVVFGYPAWQLAPAAVSGNVHLLPTTGPDFDPHARPGFAVLDARTGAIMRSRTTIPSADLKRGFAGGGIWGTPVIDPVSRYAFAGTSNPYSKTKEHAYDNAMIKIDVDPRRRTFGQVVASFKGTPDNVVGDPLYSTPQCQALGETMPNLVLAPGVCGQQDIDFGNSPTLWHAADGMLMVSQLQKLGVMYTVRAKDMSLVWESGPIGTDSQLTLTGGNHGNAATDGRTLYVMTNPGLLEALDAATGALRWAAPLAEPIASKNVALAGGVVLVSDYAGLHGFDAASGGRVWDFPGAPAALTCGNESDMISVAHGTVFANCGGTIAAFRLPA